MSSVTHFIDWHFAIEVLLGVLCSEWHSCLIRLDLIGLLEPARCYLFVLFFVLVYLLLVFFSSFGGAERLEYWMAMARPTSPVMDGTQQQNIQWVLRHDV